MQNKVKKPVYTRMMVTPEIAREILEQNTCNRKLNRDWVNRYAQQMSNGEWDETGQTLSLSSNHVLLDGQHRLHAVIKSGIPRNFIIVKNLKPSGNYDNGRRRTIRDSIQVEYGDMPSVHALSLARIVEKIKHDDSKRIFRNYRDEYSWVKENLQNIFGYKLSAWKGNRGPNAAMMVALFFYYVDSCKKGMELVAIENIDTFIKVYKKGYAPATQKKDITPFLKIRNVANGDIRKVAGTGENTTKYIKCVIGTVQQALLYFSNGKRGKKSTAEIIESPIWDKDFSYYNNKKGV